MLFSINTLHTYLVRIGKAGFSGNAIAGITVGRCVIPAGVHCPSPTERLMTKPLGLGSLLLLAGALLLCGAPTLADSISVSNANDGFGSSYTLTANCTGNVCDVTLSIDTTGATNTDISNVAFKIGTTDLLTGTLTAPTADSWSTITSSLSSGGCLGGNSDGQICSSATGDFADTGGTLTWTWTNVQVTGDLTIGHVGYKYDTSDTLGKGLIVSDNYPTSVPEPSALSLLAIGLLGLAAIRKFVLT
jgi:PEP-CTERM motif